jgi:peptidoglycan/LPS O-acetylase OafA/YrhL
MTYRRDIDGLRAVAVLAVVFYHAGLGFPGGFVGVDVFFVISGFLITSIIIKELKNGTFSMVNFWERRVRRILPASIVTLMVVFIAGWFLLLPSAFLDLSKSVISQVLFVSNIYFWRTTNYFSPASEQKPLLNTWSLAVEEQFYFFFPLAVIAVWWAWTRWQKNKPDRILGTTNHTNLHEKVEPPITPIDTDGSKEPDLRLVGQAGAAFSNPHTSQLARDCANTAPTSFASIPAPSDTSYSPPATSPGGDSRRRALFWLFAAVALLSLGLSIWGVKAQPYATFFLLPTRAWELLCGAMLAVVPARSWRLSHWVSQAMAGVGLIGILVPVFFYSHSTAFPGIAALPPCLGAVLLIWANGNPLQPTWAGRLLSLKLLVFVGLISYSLYLWHWPIFAFFRYWELVPYSSGFRFALVGAGFVVAVASYYFVEQPFRRKVVFQPRREVFLAALCGSSLLLIAGLGVLSLGGAPTRFAEEVLATDRASVDIGFAESFKTADIIKGRIGKIGIEGGEGVDVLVWGDSHAMAIVPAVDKGLNALGLSGRVITHSETAPIQNFSRISQYGLGNDSIDWANAALDYIKLKDVIAVILMANWEQHIGKLKGSEIGDFDIQLMETVETISKYGAVPILILEMPRYAAPVPRILAHQVTFNSDANYFWEKSKNHAYPLTDRKKFLVALQEKGALVIDPKPNFSNEGSTSYPGIRNGTILFRDAGHLTPSGASEMLVSLFQDIFQRIKTNERIEADQ